LLRAQELPAASHLSIHHESWSRHDTSFHDLLEVAYLGDLELESEFAGCRFRVLLELLALGAAAAEDFDVFHGIR